MPELPTSVVERLRTLDRLRQAHVTAMLAGKKTPLHEIEVTVKAIDLEPVLTHWDQAIEAAAAVVDQCNREGPYNAIAAAPRIRALALTSIDGGIGTSTTDKAGERG